MRSELCLIGCEHWASFEISFWVMCRMGYAALTHPTSIVFSTKQCVERGNKKSGHNPLFLLPMVRRCAPIKSFKPRKPSFFIALMGFFVAQQLKLIF